MAAKLKKGDRVVVLTGKDKGKKGEIVPSCRRTARPSWTASTSPSATPASPRIPGRPQPKAMPIDLSNLALIDANGKATRVGFRSRTTRRSASPRPRGT
jgi:large subunit ribosomal protein L24